MDVQTWSDSRTRATDSSPPRGWQTRPCSAPYRGAALAVRATLRHQGEPGPRTSRGR